MELSEKLKLYLVLETKYLQLPLSDFLEIGRASCRERV